MFCRRIESSIGGPCFHRIRPASWQGRGLDPGPAHSVDAVADGALEAPERRLAALGVPQRKAPRGAHRGADGGDDEK